MGKRKTIVFVMPRLPYPALSGRKNSLYNYCRIISEDLGYRLVVVAFLESGDSVGEIPSFIDKLLVLPKISFWRRVKVVISRSFLLRKWPMQVSLFWSTEANRIIEKIVEEEQPQFIFGDMVRTTEYIKNADAIRVADLDDRISLRYQRQLEHDKEEINPYGNFINILPEIVQKIVLWNPIREWVLKNEISLLKKYEVEIGKKCDKTIFVAENEAKAFNEEIREKKAVAVPIGVDTEYFYYQEAGIKDNIIGFLGAMNVAHNESAVKFFIKSIFPQIKKEIPDVKLLVIGGGPSEQLLTFRNENVSFTGRVKDVREYIKKCKVFVCPMLFGSGIKTKNLEVMAMGVPVVTTSIGAENINAENRVDWIIEDNPAFFAYEVIRVLNDDAYRKQLEINGREYVQKNFSWNKAKQQLESILQLNDERE